MSAAEVLKAELAGLVPVKPASSMLASKVQVPELDDLASDFDVPGLGNVDPSTSASPPCLQSTDESMVSVSFGQKRSATDVEIEDAQIDAEDVAAAGENDDSAEDEETYAMVVRADGSVQQADSVRYESLSQSRSAQRDLNGSCELRLYEPGYKERYYQHKFGVSNSDTEFRKTSVITLSQLGIVLTFCTRVTQHYLEGMAWVLHYYYQGVSLETKICENVDVISSQDTLLAMVLSFPFCSLCLGFRGCQEHEDKLHPGSTV